MIETETPVSILILLSCCVGLLLVALVSIYKIFKKLARIENLLSHNAGYPEVVELTSSSGETPGGGAFEAFLNEDASRRALTKSEQFAAYRQWRQEKGMNWSNS